MGEYRKLRSSFDSKDAQLELDRLAKGFDGKTRARLAGEFERAWQETQQKVHVLSGALKASGRKYISDSDTKWRGTITYGGYTPIARYKSSKNHKPRTTSDAHTVDYAALENYLGAEHHFFDETVFEHAMDNIQADVVAWLVGNDARNAAKRQRHAANADVINAARRTRYAQNRDVINAKRRARYARRNKGDS